MCSANVMRIYVCIIYSRRPRTVLAGYLRAMESQNSCLTVAEKPYQLVKGGEIWPTFNNAIGDVVIASQKIMCSQGF